MITFHSCDRRYPFLWESQRQPAARWHAPDDGPAQYLADTPDGAWAEFLRHEEITDAADLAGVSRALWAVDVEATGLEKPTLPQAVMRGDLTTYPACQREAKRLRTRGFLGIVAPAAALAPGTAGGYRVDGGFVAGPRRDGSTVVLFGQRPDAVGWLVVDKGRPPAELLERVRHL